MLTCSPSYSSLLVIGLVAIGCVRGDPEGRVIDPVAAVGAAPSCEGADGLARVWSGERREAFRGALAQSVGRWPEQAFASLDARIGEHAGSWAQIYAGACERGELAIMRCLDERVWELDALIALIIEQPERAAALWLELDRSVADPRRCERSTLGSAAPALDLERGRKLASLRLGLEIGAHAEVLERIDALEDDAAIRDTPAYALRLALAKAGVALADDQLDAADSSIARASDLVERAGPREAMAVDDARARVAAALGDVEAVLLAGEQALTAARAVGDRWLLLQQLRQFGVLLIELDTPDRAIAPLTEAIALAGRLRGPENPQTAELQTILAKAQLALGEIQAAHDSLTQARDAFVIALGPDHPQTLAAVEAIGRLFIAAGRPGDAQFAFLDLLEINRELYGPKHWRSARIKLELGDSLMAMDQHESARTLYTEALTPLAQELGPEHPAVIRASIHLGIAELALGNLEAAQGHCARGKNLAKALPPGGVLASEAEQCLAAVLAPPQAI